MRSVGLLSIVLLVSGCTKIGPSYDFGGSFTDRATQADIEEFQGRMRGFGADDVLILESFPAQFLVRGLDQDCEVARTEAIALAYVREVTPCRQTRTSPAGDGAVSDATSS